MIKLIKKAYGVQGRRGYVVFRKQANGENRSVFGAQENNHEPSAGQERVRQRFTEASAYCKGVYAIPARRAAYLPVAELKNMPVFATMVTDFLQKPVIRDVETAVYHGHEGDSINVFTRPDLTITAVAVRLIGAEDVDLESGAAVFADGAWRYSTLTEIPLGTAITVEVKVTDSDGLVVTRLVPIVVA